MRKDKERDKRERQRERERGERERERGREREREREREGEISEREISKTCEESQRKNPKLQMYHAQKAKDLYCGKEREKYGTGRQQISDFNVYQCPR